MAGEKRSWQEGDLHSAGLRDVDGSVYLVGAGFGGRHVARAQALAMSPNREKRESRERESTPSSALYPPDRLEGRRTRKSKLQAARTSSPTVRTGNIPRLRFTATLGEEPEDEVGLG